MKYILMVCLLLSTTACSIVSPQERAVGVTLGKVANETLSPGVYLWVPFLRQVEKMDMLIQKSEVETTAGSLDLQEIKTNFAINWRVDPSQVLKVFTSIGNTSDILKNLINPALSEVLKSATAKYTAEEILTKRHELKQLVDNEIKVRMLKYGVIVEEVNITHIDFSKDFSAAIERKQVAEQEAKQAHYESLKAEQQAKSAVFKAKGEAEAQLVLADAKAKEQRMLNGSITNELLQLKAIEKWNGNMPQITGSAGNMMFNIPAGTNHSLNKGN